MDKKSSRVKLQYDVCGRCGVLFDDQGENGWWIENGTTTARRGRRTADAGAHVERGQAELDGHEIPKEELTHG